MYYLLLFAASVLFSVQFVFTKCFQKIKGGGFFYSLVFGLIVSLVSVPIFLAVNGFKFEFSVFSLVVAAIYTANNIILTAFSTKALTCADLSLYSLFMLLGGMIVPFLYGICVGESVNAMKIIGVVAVSASMFVSLKPDKNKKNSLFAIACMIVVFVCNGLSGIITAYHQSGVGDAVGSSAFLMLQNVFRAGISIVILAVIAVVNKVKTGRADGEKFAPENQTDFSSPDSGAEKKQAAIKAWIVAISVSAGYAVVNGAGNFFTTVSVGELPAVVVYPIITGCGVFFSTLFGLFFGEKIDLRKTLSVLLVISGTVLMMF